MKTWIEKWWGLCIVITMAAVIAAPFIINAAYMIGADKPNTVFTESNLLSIYATISSVLATIIGICVAYRGIVMTINYNQKSNDEVRRNNVLPVIVFDEILWERPIQNLAVLSIQKPESKHIDPEESAEAFREYALNELVFVFSENAIQIFPHLTAEQSALIVKHVIPEIDSPHPNMTSVRYKYNKVLYLPVMLTNAGLGVAINLHISLIGNGNKKTSYPINTGKDKSIRVTFFAEDAKYANGDYELCFDYRDIYTNEYMQKHELKFNNGHYEYTPFANQTLKINKEDTPNE